MSYNQFDGPDDPQPRTILRESIRALELTVRAMHCLRKLRIEFIDELILKRATDLLRIPGFGQLTLREVRAKLAARDLYLLGESPQLASQRILLESEGLRTLLLNALENAGIKYVDEVAARTPRELRRLKNIGRVALLDLELLLRRHKLHFRDPSTPPPAPPAPPPTPPSRPPTIVPPPPLRSRAMGSMTLFGGSRFAGPSPIGLTHASHMTPVEAALMVAERTSHARSAPARAYIIDQMVLALTGSRMDRVTIRDHAGAGRQTLQALWPTHDYYRFVERARAGARGEHSYWWDKGDRHDNLVVDDFEGAQQQGLWWQAAAYACEVPLPSTEGPMTTKLEASPSAVHAFVDYMSRQSCASTGNDDCAADAGDPCAPCWARALLGSRSTSP